MHGPADADLPIPSALEHFDRNSGTKLERLVFNNRRTVIVICAVLTVVLGIAAALRLTLNASFEKMIPRGHPYIQNYLENRNDLRGLGNALRIVVANPQGDIYDPKYLDTLRQISDELVLTPGVDRAWVKSLWTPAVRWTEVTEEGFRGGPVMPDNYDGSPKATEQLRGNIARSGIVGSLVGNDFKSSMIVVPLLDKDPTTGERIDYRALSASIEAIRAKYEAGADGKPATVRIHAIGFAKLVGDLIDGLFQVALYFAFAALIAAIIIYGYTRCVRSTALVIACSLVAVVWQLGLVALLRLRAGSVLDPGAVPGLRDRRVARRAEDERHHAGHRPRRAQAGRRALHVQAPVPRRADRAAGGCSRIRGADGDRHRRDQGPRADGQHRRRGADLHQPDPAAGPAFVCRRQRGRRAAQPARRQRRATRPRIQQGLGSPRALHRAALGDRRDRGCDGAGGRRLRGQHAARDRRPGPGRARTAAGLALQPRQRLHHRQLLAVERPVRGDREDREGRLPEVRRRWSRPTASRGRCSRCRACRRRCRSPMRCARSPRAATRAARSG